ncbi:MAG: aminoacyl-tRNA hydrolase [Xanthomonadaceae bacterium]|nr:aminoacyl-tRNA hydrolase [Xanthomonadaceae bacterium]
MTLEQEVEFTFARSSGPGGQNVNKVNSKAVLRWNPLESQCISLANIPRLLRIAGSHCTTENEIIIMSDRFRDQLRNKEDCLEKLRAMIETTSRPPKPRKKTKPSRSSVRQKHESKRKHSQKKAARRGSYED